MKGTIGLRLALWYAGAFIGSSLVLVLLTYALLASSLRQRDQEIVVSTLRDYATRYESGGLAALIQAVELEQRAGRHERLFVRVLSQRHDALFMTMPPEWGSFDIDRLRPGDDRALAQAPATDRPAVLEVASARLWDGTILQVGKSSESREQLLDRFRTIVGSVGVAVILVGVAGGAIFTRSTLQPIRRLAAVVSGIVATGRTDARVPGSQTGDELDELSTSFNQMLDRISGLITAMRDSLDNVAHDLRTPMTRLRGIAERALAAGTPEGQREALADCLEESDRVLAILNTLMDISEAETGTLRLTLETVPLAPLVSEVVELYEHVAQDAGVSVTTDVPQGLNAHADRDRLRQVLANLFDNAIKYTPPAGNVHISAEARERDLIVCVRDTGIGIPADEQGRIWERLYRADRSRTARGLGLGLSLVRAYVQAQRGTVTVESAPGRGSTFTVSLPRAPSDTSGT
jgi:signal transduction histidine kinase